MSVEQIDLSISIVNTNNKELLKSCLKSIYKNTKKTKFEIVVVDNFSDDGSAEMIKNNFPEVKLIKLMSRNGYGYCHNKAVPISCGKYFLVFNEDMIVLPNAIDIMVEQIKKDKTIGALGCKLLNPDRTLQYSCSKFPTLFSDIFENIFPQNFIFPKCKLRRDLFYWDHDHERDVEVIMGSCMLIPKLLIDRIGLFDEQFFLYADELDLCKRILNENRIIHFSPRAEIIHYGAQSTNKIPLKKYIINYESKIKYFKKHHGYIQSVIVSVVNFLGFIIRIFGWSFIMIFQSEKRKLAQSTIKIYTKVCLWRIGIA